MLPLSFYPLPACIYAGRGVFCQKHSNKLTKSQACSKWYLSLLLFNECEMMENVLRSFHPPSEKGGPGRNGKIMVAKTLGSFNFSLSP